MSFFIRQYGSTLRLLLLLAVVVNTLLLLDEGFAGVSVLYVNSICFIICAVSFSWQVRKDRERLKQIEQAELTPVQQAVATHYKEQLQQLKHDVTMYKLQVAEHSDEQLAWIHEMKTPLTAQQLLIEQLLQHDVKVQLEQEWLRIMRLLDQQLYSARLHTLEQDVRYERINLQAIVTGEVKEMRALCLQKGIGFELDELAYTVVADAKWLAYIVRQLISNAIKYSRPNSEVSIAASIDEKGHLQLHVKDEGVGIAAHDLPRVFRKSYTGTSGRESTAASGMGLYLAQQAAQKMGLKLTLQSVVEQGTTATITFPLENEYTKIGM